MIGYGVNREMDSIKSKKLVKKRTHKKHKTKRRKQNDSSGDESIDISEEVFPITHYISNREQMIEQVFSVMEKEKLNCMLPPALKGLTLNALKESCLKELKNMSDDEVRQVLCGEAREPISDNNSIILQPDSDSRDSVSSIEECPNVEEKKQTLLDILELEMQEIAYNTVLKKDETTECSTDSDDIPEILAITPTNSCKSQTNVPLICIDSGDEESSSPPNQLLSNNVTVSNTEHSESNLKIHTEAAVGGTSLSSTLKTNTALLGTPEDSDKLQVSSNSKTSSSSKENFLIKVFSNNNAPTGRVVQKVLKSSCEDISVDMIQATNDKECERSKEESIDNIPSHSAEDNIEEIVVSDSVETTETDTRIPTSNTSPTHKVSNSKNNCDTVHVLVENEKLSLNEEREEGEISGEDSDEEVNRPVDNKEEPAIVCLPSDSSSEKSEAEKSESKPRDRRHHHRHRRNKHRTNSPERSRRRIEKRGNRSYRRKTVTEKAGSPEKIQEVFTQDIDLNSICLPPGEMPVKLSSQNDVCIKTPLETPPLEDSNLLKCPAADDVTKETMDTEIVISPRKLEGEVEDKSGSFQEPEESQLVEPVSTKTSWADRWAEKKDLKKVVITSKICRNVRKRILSARKKQTVVEPVSDSTPVLPPVPPLVLHVEGSVQEYQMLQLLVSNGSDEENNGSKSMGAENLLDTVVSDSTTDSKYSLVVPEGDSLSTPLTEDQEDKT